MDSILRRCWARRRDVVQSCLFWSGLGACYELVAKPTGAIILLYHSVAPDDVAPFIDPPNRLPIRMFERQMEFLHGHRKVIPLADLVSLVKSGRTPAAGTVCITFDDGYLDNLTVAAPILARLRLPATVFLATGYVDTAKSQWADVIHVAFTRRTKHRLRIASLGLEADLEQPFQREDARERLHRHLLEARPETRSGTLSEVERQLAPRGGSGPRLTMNWDDARELRDRYPLFEIGGHSRHHTDLQVHGADTVEEEVAGCASDLQRELGTPARLFAFPYGRGSDAARRLVQQQHWQAAVGTSRSSRVGLDSDLFDLPRVDSPRSMTALRFKTSGAYPGSMRVFWRNG